MSDFLSRSAPILGEDGIEKLKRARVAVFGIGGVGGHAAEALCRGGVGKIDLFDADTVSVSNLNRQIVALRSTLGRSKVGVMKDRILDINPECEVRAYEVFYSAENADSYELSAYDYVIDAIDTVKSKLLLIARAKAVGVRIISSMGAGNKLDPTSFTIADIYDTSVCPLAKVMRSELRRMGIENLKVVYSKEAPIKAVADSEFSRHAPGSVPFVPSVVGLIMAGEVIKDIISDN
ncbi:MAG: tRNA threonylcarbamoyladenosine dehydratase [Clostridia bacterium]|nr:tRNA threonylcarbamoyladenosine dehydratase [Clostridia bacterium]